MIDATGEIRIWPRTRPVHGGPTCADVFAGPNERYHIDILRQSCERFIFVQKGVVTQAPDFDTLVQAPAVRTYLGALAP